MSFAQGWIPTHEYWIRNREIRTEIRLSSSLVSALNNLTSEQKPSAIEIIREIIKIHGELADKEGKELINNVIRDAISEQPSFDPLTVSVTLGQRKEVEEWIKDVIAVYVKEEEKIRELHVKLFIVGLCLTGIKLRANKFVEKIRDEVKGTIYPDLLTEKGRKLWRHLFNIYEDKVSTHKDAPTRVDQLGRMSFAKFLVDLLYQVRNNATEKDEKKDAFILHIDGAWGSGKSSLFLLIKEAIMKRAQKENPQKSSLALVREALRLKAQKENPQKRYHYSIRDALKKYRKEKPTRWIIVDFNAWQNQRIGPPWWSLMDTVYTQSRKTIAKKSKLCSLKLFLWETQWRLRMKHSNFLLSITVTSAIIGSLILAGIIQLPSLTPNEPINLGNATHTQTENLIGKDLGSFVSFKFTGIIAFIVAAFSFFGVIKTSLVPGSSQAAKEFMEVSNDPMNRIKGHFIKLVAKIRGLYGTIIIFIDDLDRCKDNYTVEFLEGIQTLFREVNIIYIIAADKRWIYSSYEKSYETFKSYLDQPGFPFGHLFLQKIFQLSVFMPSPSKAVNQAYWDRLISSSSDMSKEDIENAEKDAERKISASTNEAEMLDEIKLGNQNPIYQQRLRQKAIEKLATPEVQTQIEHMLKPFVSLLDPNPRSLKRFVNIYQLIRATDLLRGGTIEREKLALWTILWYRWPDLAQCLKENPGLIKYVYKTRQEIQDNKDIPDKLKNLFWSQEVINVITGNGVESHLEVEDIRDIVGLYGL